MDIAAKWNNISVPSHNRFWLKIRSSVKWCGNRYMRDENCLSLLIVHNSINKPTIVDVVKIVSRMAEQKKKRKKKFFISINSIFFLWFYVFSGEKFLWCFFEFLFIFRWYECWLKFWKKRKNELEIEFFSFTFHNFISRISDFFLLKELFISKKELEECRDFQRLWNYGDFVWVFV